MASPLPRPAGQRALPALRSEGRRPTLARFGAVGLHGLTPHALRHTAASLAIAAGQNVKVIQQVLGHKSATMTPDLYGHLFGDQLDQVADAMDAARASLQGHADFLRTNRKLIKLPRSAKEAGDR